jgi:arylsulfatase A-like enzyme
MNVILLLIDSLNRHDLEAYNPATFVRSPNLRAFAERGAVMTRHFAGSLPCMPARREITAGRREWLWRGWGHTEAFDDLLADRARRHGAVTQLITDHYHYFEHASHGYVESFDGFEFIRGQEVDNWRTGPVEARPPWVESINRWRPGWGDRYYRNVRGFHAEGDWFTPKVFHTVRDWLRANRAQEKFFLFVDHFEVHEPFYCIEPYRSMYTEQALAAQNIWPPYQDEQKCHEFLEQVSPEGLAFLRAQYWGKVSWVDKYIGVLMETLTELSLWENTMVIITTDHGHDLAMHRPRFGKQPPHHDSHAHLPLFVWHPEFAADGRSVSAITSTVDLHATVAEALGAEEETSPHSRSILPVLRGEVASRREATTTGTFGYGPMVADAGYSYTHAPVAAGPNFWYSGYLPRGRNVQAAEPGRFIPGVETPVWKIPVGDVPPYAAGLIEHAADPNTQPNLLAERPEIAAGLRERLAAILREEGCPEEQWARLGLSAGT